MQYRDQTIQAAQGSGSFCSRQQQVFISHCNTYCLMSKQSLIFFMLLKYLSASLFHSQRPFPFASHPLHFAYFIPSLLSESSKISTLLHWAKWSHILLNRSNMIMSHYPPTTNSPTPVPIFSVFPPFFFGILPFLLAFMFFFNFYFILAYCWFGLPRWHSGKESAC